MSRGMSPTHARVHDYHKHAHDPYLDNHSDLNDTNENGIDDENDDDDAFLTIPSHRSTNATIPATSLSAALLHQNPHLLHENEQENSVDDDNNNISVMSSSAIPISYMNTLLETINETRELLHDALLLSSTESLKLSSLRLTSAFAIALSKLIPQIGFEHLHSIDLSDNPLENSGVMNIIHSLRNHTSLTSLNLSNTMCGQKSGTEIAHYLLANKSLKSLNISTDPDPNYYFSNKFDNKILKSLSSVLCANIALTSLDLSGHPLADSINYISAMLMKNKSITTLHLNNCQLRQSAPLLFAACAHNTSLKHLEVMHNQMQPNCGEDVKAMLLANKTLGSLCLRSNPIGSAVPSIVEALFIHPSLKSLDLSLTSMESEGAIALAEVLRHSALLTNLNCSHNRIDPIGACALAEALSSNSALIHLNLSGNPLFQSSSTSNKNAMDSNTKESMPVFLEVLANSLTIAPSMCALKTLALSSCRLSGRHIISLFLALPPSLKSLILRDNCIEAQIAEAIPDILSQNRTILKCDVTGNQFDILQLNSMARTCARNRQLLIDAEPRRLKLEMKRMRGQQFILAEAQQELVEVQKNITQIREKKAAIIFAHEQEIKEAEDLGKQIEEEMSYEQEQINLAHSALIEVKTNIQAKEDELQGRFDEIHSELVAQQTLRESIDQQTEYFKSQSQYYAKERPAELIKIQQMIAEKKVEKNNYVQVTNAIRHEYARIAQARRDNIPIPHLIYQLGINVKFALKINKLPSTSSPKVNKPTVAIETPVQ